MQLHQPVDSLSSTRLGRLLAPRFMGLLIAGMLLALVCFSILISITFQHVFVPAPLIVHGGIAHPIPLASTATPWRPGSSGTQIINRR